MPEQLPTINIPGSKEQEISVSNILLTAQGTIGDLVLVLRVGNILKAGGDSVTMITHGAYEKLVRQAGLEFVASDTADEFERYIAATSLCETPRGNIEFQKRHVLPMADREVALLCEQCADPTTIVIGSHMFLFGAQAAAEKMGRPLVRVFPGAVNVARLFMFEIMCKDVLAEAINDLRNRNGLPKVTDWAAWTRFPQRNIGAWPSWFAPPEPDWPDDLDLVLPGFLTMDELEAGDLPPELEAFLNAGEPPILITGGTGTFLKKGFYNACAEGCRLAGRRGILASRFPESLPNPLPEGIKWFPYLPFESLMPRVAGVIHHGGLGTLARAMRRGVPQLVLAMGSDRPDNAQRLQRLGVGEYLPPSQWNPERVAAALNRLIVSPEVHARCHEMVGQIRADDPETVIRNAIHGLIKK